MKTTFTFIILIISSLLTLSAQDFLITGTVIDEEGNPLPGATVRVSGTSRATVVDFDGQYGIEANPFDTLEYSFIGYAKQIIKVGDHIQIDVQMEPEIITLYETLICANSHTEPELFSGNYFPYGIGALFLSEQFGYCCRTRYRLKMGAYYGTNLDTNQIINTRLAIDYIKISRLKLGFEFDYNYMNIREYDNECLLTDYRGNLLFNKVLKYFTFELGIGKQRFNDLDNIGYGGKISFGNEYSSYGPYFEFELYSGFWNWSDYAEYTLGIKVRRFSKKSYTNSRFRNVSLGCEYRKLNTLRFVNFSLGFRILTGTQLIGCS